MTTDFFSEHWAFRHGRGSRQSTYLGCPALGPTSLETTVNTGYTRTSKSKSFRAVICNDLGPLQPLRYGEPVTLAMKLPPRSGGGKKILADGKPIPVVIIPGPVFGTRDGRYLIAVVGRGSAVVAPGAASSVSSLVLAGMPSSLAQLLMDQLRRVSTRR